jgi:hypothetical protein
MQAMLCDGCQKPMNGDAFELALLRGTLVSGPGEPTHLAATQGILSATLCERCGSRLGAIVQRKLQSPCPTCEVAPMRDADHRAMLHAAV